MLLCFDFCRDINWGDAPTWIAAIGALIAIPYARKAWLTALRAQEYTERTFIFANKAYIVIPDIKIGIHPDNPNEQLTSFTITNAGKTAMKNVSVEGKLFINGILQEPIFTGQIGTLNYDERQAAIIYMKNYDPRLQLPVRCELTFYFDDIEKDRNKYEYFCEYNYTHYTYTITRREYS